MSGEVQDDQAGLGNLRRVDTVHARPQRNPHPRRFDHGARTTRASGAARSPPLVDPEHPK
ncbi:hypothetical protein [Streptomyces sp. NPDC058155]|uniref:hypothetical protein n=1 Tax=Streptomyces sp. NPDC058155 TaxID=3346359 RepID=UPI0036E88930